MSEDPPLVLCAGTIMQADTLEAKLEAAQRAGFSHVSLWYSDYAKARAGGLSDIDIRTTIADHGLAVNETEVLAHWAPVDEPPLSSDPVLAELLALREEDLFLMAAAVGAKSVTAVELLGSPVALEPASVAFGLLCDRAADHGLVVNLEFMPFSGIANLNAANQIVEGAARPNGGINVDAWHFYRSDSTLAELAAIPGERVTLVQLSDAPAVPPRDIRLETGTGRLLPGEGDIDLIGILNTLNRIGCTAPIGLEVFSSRLTALPAVQVARLGMTALHRLMSSRTQYIP